MKLNIDDLGVVGIVVDDWDISKSFKPKTITTDYSSWIVYISRRAVPANTPITDNYYWKPLTRLQDNMAFDYNQFKEAIEKEFANLYVKFNSFLGSSSSYALDDKFGDSEILGINQKTLTEAFNKLWEKIESMTGEFSRGINMVINPTYFIGSDGPCPVHIHASSALANGKFEYIAFYGNGELITEAENVEFFEYDTEISETTEIECVAKIMGIEYRESKTVTKYDEFWLFAGTWETEEDLEALMNNPDNVIPIENNMMRCTKDITCEQGDNIIVVVGDSLSGYLRADMNGYEIPFDNTDVIINDTFYKVYTSKNKYNAATYNIDING